MSPPHHQPFSPSPSRSIRAHYTPETITLYQAYNTTIATSAITHQHLSSSPSFLPGRMTWFKPSWNWMMYRSGYSYKDANQARILAIEIPHARFEELLGLARLADQAKQIGEKGEVVVQWDPERDTRIGRVEGGVRSIQIGVKGEMGRRVVDEWITGIRDVTGQARELKKVLDGEGGKERVGDEELRSKGLLPVERVYDGMLSLEVRRRLGMDGDLDEFGMGEGGEEGGE